METCLFDEAYLFKLISFIGMKRLEYLYRLNNWTNMTLLIPFFGYQGEILKILLQKRHLFILLCDVYGINPQDDFEALVYKYKKKHLFTNKYDCEDRIKDYATYMTSYEALKKAARMKDFDFIHYMLNVRKLKYSDLHLKSLAEGLYEFPELTYKYMQPYLNKSEFSYIPVLLEPGFIKACKYGVSVETYNKYIEILDEYIGCLDKYVGGLDPIGSYIVGYQHNHLMPLLTTNYDICLSAIICDNIELLSRSLMLSNRNDIIASAVAYGSVNVLKYLQATKDEIINIRFHGQKRKVIKYLYFACKPDEEIYTSCDCSLSFKSKRWLYKKYKIFVAGARDNSNIYIEFLHISGLIYQQQVCMDMISKIGSYSHYEFIEILLRIKDDERVKELFNENIIRKLEDIFRQFNENE